MSTASSSITPAVEVTHLRKVYGSGRTEVVAMRDATLSIAPGEIVGMFGPSGSGKSTLLTAMALINPPTSGQISIRGKPVMDGPQALVDLRAFRRQHLGFVFQKANLIPFLTALENVQIALEVNDTAPKLARKRAMELLDYLSIGARAHNLPVALSGGEQQRVAVARALANEPSLILADEPTASLDSKLGQQVMELFAKIAHERHAGVLVVTHDYRTLDIFDRILDVEDGMISVRAKATSHQPNTTP
jgi:putative ABC transport system ATP-binding protein